MNRWLKRFLGNRCWGFFFLIFINLLLYSCAFPVRQAYKVDNSVPMGRIEGEWFVGQRYPFKVKIPAAWHAATQYPEFLVDQGYGVEGLKATPFFLFNPQTKSSIQFDFSPAGRTVRFTQEMIEDLTRLAGGGLVAEIHTEHGKDTHIQLKKAFPIQLRGVPYAARMSALFAIKGESREQGWIYAFAEPFQIFILFLITDKDRNRDEAALEEALSSFEYFGMR